MHNLWALLYRLAAVYNHVKYREHPLIWNLLKGNYSDFNNTMVERLKAQSREYESQMEFRKHVQEFIDKFRLVQEFIDKFRLVQEFIDKFSLVQEFIDKYRLVQEFIDKYRLVQELVTYLSEVDYL